MSKAATLASKRPPSNLARKVQIRALLNQLERRCVKSTVLDAMRQHPRTLRMIIGARTAENTGFYLVVAFALAYAANQFNIPKPQILHAITAGAVWAQLSTLLQAVQRGTAVVDAIPTRLLNSSRFSSTR